jgi:hypothetical protein
MSTAAERFPEPTIANLFAPSFGETTNPPSVSDTIARQRDTLTDKSRSNAVNATARRRKERMMFVAKGVKLFAGLRFRHKASSSDAALTVE